MTTEVLLDKFTPGALAFIPGADNTDAINAAFSALPMNVVAKVAGTVTHDRRLVVPNKRGVWVGGLNYGDGFQTLTDTGGLDGRNARTRSHLRVDGGEDVGTCRLNIGGTHPETGSNRSPDIPASLRQPGDPFRDIWEDQCGVEFHGVKNGLVYETDIHNVWGDFVDFEGKGSGTNLQPSIGMRAIGGHWHRNGRVALLAHASDMLWKDTKVTGLTSDLHHIEASGNPRGAIYNQIIDNIQRDHTGNRTSTISSGAIVDGVTFRKMGARVLDLFVNGDAGALGECLIRRVRIEENVWTEPIKALARFFDIDIVDVCNNVGLIQKRNNPYPKGLQYTRCSQINEVGNKFTFV